jgi:NAD(P)-dependent dehydrogenase (short-subunit alcohol dehydrogenase family)
MNPRYDFSGQVALVTGAGQGMGLATAKAFAASGCAIRWHRESRGGDRGIRWQGDRGSLRRERRGSGCGYGRHRGRCLR